MATIISSNIVSNSNIVSYSTNSTNSIFWTDRNDKSDKMIEFIEFALEIMGVNLKYSEFENMSGSEKIAMIRDLKINKIID